MLRVSQATGPPCGWWGVWRSSRAGWRCSTRAGGAACVTTSGTTSTPRWSVDSWAWGEPPCWENRTTWSSLSKGSVRFHVDAMQRPCRRFNAVVNLYGSASGFIELTNHGPCCCVASTKVTIFGRRTSGPCSGQKEVLQGRNRSVALTWNHNWALTD